MPRLFPAVIALAAGLHACAPAAGPASGSPALDLLSADAPDWVTVGESVLRPQWVLEDGVLSLAEGGGGDVTNAQLYGDFTLEFEWRVAPGGNSGVMYRVDPGHPGAPYETGPEYQVLDNARHADGASPLTSAGAVYGLYSTDPGAARPAGQWNTARIDVRGDAVEHWLNGQRVAAYQLGSEDFGRRVAAGKFGDWPGFGRAQRGLIVLQDHGDAVSYRNMRLRE